MAPAKPIHLLASFSDKDQFLQNYMYHVPSGGVFVDLGLGTPPPLLGMDRRELQGQVAEVRIVLTNPRLEMGFRGAITYASPFKPGVNHRRVGVEFFRYENAQKDFLLQLLSDGPLSAPAPRRHRRFPAAVRVQFETSPSLRIVGKTEEISSSGCSFHSVKFLQPGTSIQVKLLLPSDPQKHLKTSAETIALPITATVRWNHADNFDHRYMGLEFDFSNPQAATQRDRLSAFVDHLQDSLEQDLIRGRRLGPSASA